MSLVLEGGRVPPRWAEARSSQPVISLDDYNRQEEGVRIAFINNMPDPALEDTEMQFFELLNTVAGDVPVRIKLYSLPGIPRGERGQQHLNDFYFHFDDLWNSRFDAVIVTGTEPCSPNLRDEPYWPVLAELLDWAERNTVSAVLSCLAAHASVLHSDGIDRHKLSDKQFGVFASSRVADHALTNHAGDLLRFPHSRWNEVREDALVSCGYVVLAKSAEAGVDSFVKKKKKSLFVHFQGHPEYGARTLMKEYRRDIRRFVNRERETYPSMPRGYFDAAATKLLTEFREKVLSSPSEELMTMFPEPAIAGTLQNSWHSSATCVYQNWLQYVVSKKADASVFAALAAFSGHVQRKRSAMP
ncbi:MAG: homoserine O-succinyltransferase [Acidobacteria bacterium]|nr:MAG: homoserine O-succinyltransferase [Acidobacteriota bacterium]